MPSHVLVNGLGLTYKSTIGISIATIPDVCKTPSPGGPIPIPYPNIANQGTLGGGTTTVKAKGKMIAIKGSQYKSSNGDEPGTAGGVKSNVNMKATDWITYSFDVKMDGKNACRHTDKKFHNNQNTVDLAGNLDPAVGGLDGGDNPFEIKCQDAPASSKDKLTDCQKKEICAKCGRLNAAMKDPKYDLSRVTDDKATYKATRKEGNAACAAIHRQAKKGKGIGGEGKPEDMGFQVTDEECEKELKQQAADNDYKGFSPDHVQELQLGGHPTNPSNLLWMTSRANSWVGTTLKNFDPKPKGSHTGVKPDCCE
ncbi:DUF4150 domain-containing protein [Ruegeria sp. WL0004]|uniref:DUF4150 domain-containing protein n=1 Tax=Ruegeria marisflavi TaxID=2984152 RepID=A0ABT2WVY6_9RHOB|nr:DUF4150 domain-containing protein [Ruegeria sp. WL0004]MCU9840062.1 DUF4150 domain-containing protein [Ruegeria sp. WL0004]